MFEDSVRHLMSRWRLGIAIAQHDSLAEACRQTCLPRHELDNARWTWQQEGPDALRRHAQRIVRRNPQYVAKVKDELTALTRAYPGWGRKRLATALTRQGYPVSPTQVRRLLTRLPAASQTSDPRAPAPR